MTKPKPIHYRGVCWHAHGKKFRVKLRKHSRFFYLGYYVDPKDAARVYDVAAKIMHGPDAILNFDGMPPVGMTEAGIRTMMVEKGMI